MYAVRRESYFPCAALVVALSLAQSVIADTLHDHDNGPFTGYFGIPDSTEGTTTVARGVGQWTSLLMTASHSISDAQSAESIILDGETTRLELGYRRGIGSGFEVGVELPYLWHESGGFDSFINNWHGWFGLPGGFRNNRAKGQLEFKYTDGVSTHIDQRRNENGIGDVRLVAGWRFRDGPRHAMALRFGLKLPTGDSEQLLGSGGTDLSLGLAGDLSQLFGVPRLAAYYRASVIAIGKPDLLVERSKDFVGHVGLGAAYTFGENIELLMQAAVRSPLYDSEIETLGEPAVTLTFGGNFRVSPDLTIGVGLSEDVSVQSAPDVAFQVSFRYQAQ